MVRPARKLFKIWTERASAPFKKRGIFQIAEPSRISERKSVRNLHQDGLDTAPGAPVSDPAVIQKHPKRAGSEIGAPRCKSSRGQRLGERPIKTESIFSGSKALVQRI